MADVTSQFENSVITTEANGDVIQTVQGGTNPGHYIVKMIRNKCIGAATCVAVAPKLFQMDQENIAVVLTQDELDDIKLLAAQSCPVAAIVVIDVDTGKQIWPEPPPEANLPTPVPPVVSAQ